MEKHFNHWTFEQLYLKFKLKWRLVQLFLVASVGVTQASPISTESTKIIFDHSNMIFQQFSVSGTVMDQDGLPLLGANILEKGTSNGTQADFDGKFSMKISNANATLVVSYIGFMTKEISVGGMSNVSISLQEDAQSLEEVVVTGYGGVQRNEFVGSTSVLKASELEQQPIATIEQGIRGRMAGVQVTQSSGSPGAGVSIRVRGITSFAGGNEPLYVIDGIPLFNDDVRELNGMSLLNPSDVASIEVLKDASSTAIYGSRAANGVIQITTKGGSSTKGVQVNYNVFTSMKTVRNRFDLMNGDEYSDYITQYYNNSTTLSPEIRAAALANLASVGNANTDWQDQVYRSGFEQNHNLSFSGGDADNNYYVSANYTNEQGAVKSTDFTRFSLRMNLDNKLSDQFRLNSRVSVAQLTNNGFLASDGTYTRNFGKSGIGSTMIAAPTVPVRDATGNYSNVAPYIFSMTDQENPVGLMEAVDRNKVMAFQTVLSLTWNISDHWTNVIRTSVDYSDRVMDFYSPKILIQLGSQVAQMETNKKLNALVEDYLNYKNTFGKFGVDVLLGASAQKMDRSSIFLAGTGFPSDALQDNAIQAAQTSAIPQTMKTEQALVSYFGRVQLDFDKKYLVSLNGRGDGSSVFSDNNKWANFGAIGVGWRVSEEGFMKEGPFNNLKIRASTGSVGNQAIAPYQSLTLGTAVSTGQGAGSGLTVGLAPNLPNPNLTWETTVQSDIGFDAGIANDKYRFSFDYYVKNTSQLLATVALPQSSGFTSIVDNVGKVQNKGFEIQAGVDIIDKNDWYFAIDGQFSKNTNEVIATKDDQDIFSTAGSNDSSLSTTIVRPGEALFSFYSLHFTGLDATGAPTYEDLNGDGLIDGKDRQIVGTSLPDFIYGFNTTLTYKKFSFITNWSGVQGASVSNVGKWMVAQPVPGGNRVRSTYDYYPVPREDLNVFLSDRFIEDASYLRLSNIRFGYTIDTSVLGLNNINVYISGQNLITITDYTGFDPEVNSFSGNDPRQGVDLAAYPSTKSLTLGLNLSF